MNQQRIENDKQPGMMTRAAGKMKEKSRNTLEFYLFSVSILMKIFRFHRLKGVSKTVLLRQVMFTGFDALSVIGIIALGISALTILEINQITGQLGEGQLVFELLVVIVIRQISILFTAFVLIARSGTAISTELGNMVVNKEIDLLHSFGISSFEYLVVPRVLSVIVSIFTLTLYFNLIAIVGGFFFYNMIYSQVTFGFFINRIIKELSFPDFFVPVIKSVLFGISIGLISCYQGLKVRSASTEVPQRTIRAVVDSLATVFVLDVLAALLNFLI